MKQAPNSSTDQGGATTRDASGNLHFEQVWFASVHADVGGGYPENESRLSDITLQWMLSAAALVPDGLKYDRRVLKLSPEPAGPQHDEGKGWPLAARYPRLAHCAGTTASRAIMHRSVYARFEALEVLLYDRFGKYRPPNLRNHVDFAQYYDGTPNLAPQCVADNVEDRYRAIVADEIGD